MATNTENIDLMMSRLGQRRSERVRADAIAELNAAIVDKERQPFIPWFLAGTEQVAVSTGETFKLISNNYLREVEDTQPYYMLDGRPKRLLKVTVEELDLYNGSATAPEVYTIIGNEFHFRPMADEPRTIFVRCYTRSADPIVDNDQETSNPWLINAFEYITSAALKKVAGLHIKDQEGAANFTALETQHRRELYTFHESRIHVGQDYFVGGISNGT